MRFRTILDHHQVMLARDRHDLVHLAGVTKQMNGNDGLGARRDQPLDQIRIEIPRHGFGIDRNRHRAIVIGRKRGGVEALISTSSPGPIPAADTANCRAVVPLVTATPYLQPT